MTHVQSKPEKKPRNSIAYHTPCSKYLLRNINRACQAFNKPAYKWRALSLSLSLLHLFFSIKIKGGKNRHLLSYSRENGFYRDLGTGI